MPNFDRFTDGGSTTGLTLGWTHQSDGSNGYLVVGTEGDLTSDLITGVTANLVPMQKLNVRQVPSDRFVTAWGLQNPGKGPISIVATASSSIFIAGVSGTWKDARKVEATATNTAAVAGSVTGTVVTTEPNCWTVGLFANDSGSAAVAGAGTTSRGSGGLNAQSLMDSNGPLAAGSHTLQATQGLNPNWVVIILSLTAAITEAPTMPLTIWGRNKLRLARPPAADQSVNALNNYVLAAVTGVYTYAGSAASTLATRLLAGATGIYSLSGIAALVAFGHKLLANTGVYTLTGSAASVLTTRLLAAAKGTFTLTGNAAATLWKHLLAAGTGVFTLTGIAANFARTYVLAAVSGVFSLVGQAASVVYSGGVATAISEWVRRRRGRN